MNDSVGEIVTSGAFDKLADILHKLAGPMAEEVGLLLGDKVKVYRLRNLIAVTKKMEKMLAEANLSANPIPPRLFLPILDSSSLETDETLQELWAGLLATASEQSDALPPSFIETLRQLSPNEARGLNVFFAGAKKTRNYYFLGTEATLDALLPYGIPISATEQIVEAGERLGLIRREYGLETQSGFTFDGDVVDTQELTYSFEFTGYGVRFMKACLGPSKAQQQAAKKPQLGQVQHGEHD